MSLVHTLLLYTQKQLNATMPTLGTKRTMARASQPVAKRLKTIERQVAQNKSELKYREGAATITTAGRVDLTSFIPQGTARDQRVGDQVSIKKVEVRMKGNDGQFRTRTILYTPTDVSSGNVPVESGDNFRAFIDLNQYKVWDDQSDLTRQEGLFQGGVLPGLMHTMKQTFSIPMKCKWRKDQLLPYHNPIELQVGVMDATGLLNPPTGNYGAFQYKIWYFDA